MYRPALILTLFTGAAFAAPPEDLNKKNEPPMLGIHWTRDVAYGHQALKQGSTRNNPNMTYHNGKIMPTVVSEAIFWGTSWSTYTGDKISGLDQWYFGHSGSNYAITVDEYTDNTGNVVNSTLTHQGHSIDTSPVVYSGKTSQILAEVCKVAASSPTLPNAQGNSYYPVYTDMKRGSAGYCAWHSSGTCTINGAQVPVKFAFFFNLDGDPGCDPGDKLTGHSQGLAALANVTAHEISEARSDPDGSAWWDSTGSENGDKCAWTFNLPYVTFPDGNKWKLQGEWSNAAYTAQTGYPNSSGQKGCLDGH